MEPVDRIEVIVGVALGVGGLIGCIPLILLFIDYRRRKEVHKPIIYLAVFGFTIAIALPLLLKTFGTWLALMTPFALIAYVVMTRTAPGKR